jgi:hypothetical protein
MLTAVLGLCAATAWGGALSGCILSDDNHHHDGFHSSYDTDPPPETPEPALVSIDTDQTLDATPGDGVGLFVEYSAGGNWLLWTTCDVNESGVACDFDVFASVDSASKMAEVAEVDMEGHDLVEVLDNGEAHMHAETASDIDAMSIVTSPGAILRVEVSLDGLLDQRFVYWVSDGIVHGGAPTNPVDFQPTSP